MSQRDDQHDAEPLFVCHAVRLGQLVRPRLEIPALQIPRGVTALLGYSGAGKTSLLNLLSGFEEPDAGQLDGPTLSELEKDGTCRGHALVPRYWVPENGGFWSHLTARQHVDAVTPLSGRRGTARGGAEDSANIAQRDDSSDELLQSLDLSHRSDARPAELSQGERSRLAVARALATQAAVLLMDEPLAHVDLARKQSYWDCVLQHVREQQISMVFSSHEPEIVLRAAEHVVCLEDGRVAFQGTPAELFSRPATRSTAELLGPVNWFEDADEIRHWMACDGARRQAVRPACVDLVESEESPLRVERVVDCGLYCETHVTHRDRQAARTVFHRHPASMARPGASVGFRVRPGEGALRGTSS